MRTTSSSTSSSEPATAPEPPAATARWRSWTRAFASTLAGTLAGYLALAYTIDPYDTGRSPLFSVGAVRPQGPRTAAAVRGRDPAYQGAIFGNSHIQLIDPDRLSRATGIPFVQLSVPATGPGEQFALMGWYLRHHARPRALVVSADPLWCTDDPAFPNDKPFPFWLFSEHAAVYLRGLMRWSALEDLLARIGWLASATRDTARRDGWWDYEADYIALGYAADGPKASARETPAPETPDPGRAGPGFPAAKRLGSLAAGLPEDTALVLVFPPIYAAALPRPGTPREGAEQACKHALTQALAGHPRSTVLDRRRDGPEARDRRLFFDQSHYRHPLARTLGAQIAQAIATLTEGPEGP